MAAASTPSADPRKIPMNTATAAGKKPRIGTDCSTSRVGRMMRRARRRARGQPPHGQGEGDGEDVGDGEPGQRAHEVQGKQDGPGVQLGRVERTQVRAAEDDDDDEGGDEDEEPGVDGERRGRTARRSARRGHGVPPGS